MLLLFGRKYYSNEFYNSLRCSVVLFYNFWYHFSRFFKILVYVIDNDKMYFVMHVSTKI